MESSSNFVYYYNPSEHDLEFRKVEKGITRPKMGNESQQTTISKVDGQDTKNIFESGIENISLVSASDFDYYYELEDE